MTRARTLADMISDGVIGTTELADDVITPVKLDETGSYTIAQLDVNGTLTSDGLTVDGGNVNNDSNAIAAKINANGNEHIRLEISTDSTIGNQAALDLISNSNTSRIYTTGTSGLKFSTDGGSTSHLTLDGSGNVGIGGAAATASGYSKYLHVQATSTGSSLHLTDGTSGHSASDGFELLSYNGTAYVIQRENNPLLFYTNDTERMRITSSGEVKFSTGQHMGGATSFPSWSGEGGYLKGYYNGGGSGPYHRYLDIAALGDSSWGGIMRFITNPDSSATGQERMRIAEDGYVGINYTNPTRRLYVASNDSTTGGNVVAVRNNNSTGGAFINFIAGDSNAPSIGAKGNDIVFTDDGYSGNEHLRLTNSGNLKLRSTDTSGITGGVSPYLEFRAGQTNGQNVSLAKMRGYSPGAWGGDLIFETKPANGQVNDTTVETMRIDQAGRVTMPYQPAFHAHDGGDKTSDGILFFSTASTNISNSYNTSNGRFTAPVGGTYKFSARIMKITTSGSSTVDFHFRKNGIQLVNNLYDTSATSGKHSSGTINYIVTLNAGDYVEVYTASTTSANKVHAGHREFTGFLVG